MTFQTRHIFYILLAAILKVANNYVLWLYVRIALVDTAFCIFLQLFWFVNPVSQIKEYTRLIRLEDRLNNKQFWDLSMIWIQLLTQIHAI